MFDSQSIPTPFLIGVVHQTGLRSIGGGDGIRTHCLYIANVALYQLSYTPEEVSTLPQGATRLGFALPGLGRLWLIEL